MSCEIHLATWRAYVDAIRVQDACNPSGVVRSFEEYIGTIADDIEQSTNHPKLDGYRGTDGKRWHPVFVLFASKIHDLAGLGLSHVDRYGLAYRFAQLVHKGDLVPGTDAYVDALGDYYRAYELSL